MTEILGKYYLKRKHIPKREEQKKPEDKECGN
jgi:hypothetical protein